MSVSVARASSIGVPTSWGTSAWRGTTYVHAPHAVAASATSRRTSPVDPGGTDGASSARPAGSSASSRPRHPLGDGPVAVHLGQIAGHRGQRTRRGEAGGDGLQVAAHLERALGAQLAIAIGRRQHEAVELLRHVGDRDDGFGTRPDRCLYAMLMAVSPVNGSLPVSSSYVTMPSE